MNNIDLLGNRKLVTNKLFYQTVITKPIFALILIIAWVCMMTDALATPAYMQQYGAPSCTSCHAGGAYTSSEGLAGLTAYLASKPPVCKAPQVLQDNVCIMPTTAAGAGTIVRMRTSVGVVDIRLFDSTAPLTVANFLSYINSGSYSHSFIHRSAPGFVIQGGGYIWTGGSGYVAPIITQPPVVNEFNISRPNIRGSIAMAKLGGDPNSATSQWFINLADNSANLDSQNGGFTVFGQVVEKGMSVVDTIAALPIQNYGGAFTQVPFATPLKAGALPQESNLVSLLAVSTTSSNINASGSDRLFDYLEAVYPEYLSPANDLSPGNSASSTASGYYYRYYSATNAYLGTANGNLYYMGSASKNQILNLGALSDWITKAMVAGY